MIDRKYTSKQISKFRKLRGGTKNISADQARKILNEHGTMHKALEATKEINHE